MLLGLQDLISDFQRVQNVCDKRGVGIGTRESLRPSNGRLKFLSKHFGIHLIPLYETMSYNTEEY